MNQSGDFMFACKRPVAIIITFQRWKMACIIHASNVWRHSMPFNDKCILIYFSLTVKAVTLIFISGRCSASSSAKQEKSGSIYNLVNN